MRKSTVEEIGWVHISPRGKLYSNSQSGLFGGLRIPKRGQYAGGIFASLFIIHSPYFAHIQLLLFFISEMHSILMQIAVGMEIEKKRGNWSGKY